MKRLMIIAAGEWQTPIIRKARGMKLFIVSSNLYKDSPGFEYSDIGLLADVTDQETNLEYAREYMIDAVITDQSDIAVTSVAFVAEQLGLPGIGSKIAELFTNKFLMKQFCSDHDFPVPPYKLCRGLTDVYNFIDCNGLPAVVKPPASQSSRGVSKIVFREEVAEAYKSALLHSHDGTVLLEGFIGGTELTVDGLQLNAGKHYCLATSCKSHYAHNGMVSNQLWFSQHHPEIDYEALHRQHDRLLKLMSLPFGITHAEYKYYDGRFYLIEVAARGGGTKVSSDIVPLMSGVDSNELLIRMAFGEQIDSINRSFNECFSVLDFFEFQPGVIKSISGLEKARSIKGVIDIGLNVKPGDVVKYASDDRTRHGHIIAFADTADALNSLLRAVHKTVEIHYE